MPLNYSCAGNVMSVKSTPESIEGTVADGVEVSIFNGHAMKTVTPSAGRFRTPHQATAGLYEVLFFTKNNYRPKVVVIKAGEKKKTFKVESLKKLADPKKGALAGVVYKPVSGGKLVEHSGIAQVFKGEKIVITGKESPFSVMTDERGFFLSELPAGEYDITLGGRAEKVNIEPGKTVIRNIQKGIVLY